MHLATRLDEYSLLEPGLQRPHDPAAEGGRCRRDTKCTEPRGRSIEKAEEMLSLSERAPRGLPLRGSPRGDASNTPLRNLTPRNLFTNHFLRIMRLTRKRVSEKTLALGSSVNRRGTPPSPYRYRPAQVIFGILQESVENSAYGSCVRRRLVPGLRCS